VLLIHLEKALTTWLEKEKEHNRRLRRTSKEGIDFMVSMMRSTFSVRLCESRLRENTKVAKVPV
jgi:hypothetical protein